MADRLDRYFGGSDRLPPIRQSSPQDKDRSPIGDPRLPIFGCHRPQKKPTYARDRTAGPPWLPRARPAL